MDSCRNSSQQDDLVIKIFWQKYHKNVPKHLRNKIQAVLVIGNWAQGKKTALMCFLQLSTILFFPVKICTMTCQYLLRSVYIFTSVSVTIRVHCVTLVPVAISVHYVTSEPTTISVQNVTSVPLTNSSSCHDSTYHKYTLYHHPFTMSHQYQS